MNWDADDRVERAGQAGARRRAAEQELRRILDGYGAWLRKTVQSHCPPRLGLDPAEIEQQAILRLWKAIQNEKNLDRPTSYLYRIVSTVTIDAIRSARRKREVSLEPANREESRPMEIESTQPSPAQTDGVGGDCARGRRGAGAAVAQPAAGRGAAPGWLQQS